LVLANQLIVGDIFCGAGGLSAGFRDAQAWWPQCAGERFEIAYGVDNHEQAIQTFRAFHFPGVGSELLEAVAPCMDIREVQAQDILAAISPRIGVDVLIGGPNCQGVSPAGLRNPGDERNAMLLAFIRLVRELRPKWFLMENVPGLTHANNLDLLAEIFDQFKSIQGYCVSGDVLLAADYGVPQLRHRLFIVGNRVGAPIRFPPATHVPLPPDGARLLPGSAQPYQTVRDAIWDLKDCPAQVYEENACLVVQDGRCGAPQNHYYRAIGEANQERIANIRPGQDWRYMPVGLLPERYFATRSSDQKGAYGRLLWDWPAYTITNAAFNVTSGCFTHPDYDRVLTVREAARLQSFSDQHIFHGGLESQCRQIGNAVPPKLARSVAEAILYCHYRSREAERWGTPGRLNSDLIRRVLGKGVDMPVMTPRHVHPQFVRRSSRKDSSRQQPEDRPVNGGSIWDSKLRPVDPRPDQSRRLRKLAEQPTHYRAAKRAKAIVQFLEGVPKTEVVANANVSEASVRKWVNGYFADGLEGWRAYHTSIGQLEKSNPRLGKKIRNAIARVRRTLLSPSKNGSQAGKQPKRLYMNGYLLRLIDRFGRRSVDDLILDVEQQLDASIGTVYISDLLAMCDTILSDEASLETERETV
jgi:DNA (cytosine-5)-methyltransferase 1